MTRRHLLALLSAIGLAPRGAIAQGPATKADALNLTDAQWKQRLSPAQYAVLRQAGTERAGTSPLNAERRKGQYHCAGCGTPLFTSEMKYDSGTGWPSFYTSLPGVFVVESGTLSFFSGAEYHCAKCGGHHGHVFNDGPAPSGKRYCNNGVVLSFVASAA